MNKKHLFFNFFSVFSESSEMYADLSWHEFGAKFKNSQSQKLEMKILFEKRKN